MSGLRWVRDDGGREGAGFDGDTTDCTCRAIAIASRIPYADVYDLINVFVRRDYPGSGLSKHSARLGIPRPLIREIMEFLGASWTPTMRVGQGCTVHLAPGELPDGRLIASVSKHLVAVVDGVVFDAYDPCRGGTRCVYGYWMFQVPQPADVTVRLERAREEVPCRPKT